MNFKFDSATGFLITKAMEELRNFKGNQDVNINVNQTTINNNTDSEEKKPKAKPRPKPRPKPIPPKKKQNTPKVAKGKKQNSYDVPMDAINKTGSIFGAFDEIKGLLSKPMGMAKNALGKYREKRAEKQDNKIEEATLKENEEQGGTLDSILKQLKRGGGSSKTKLSTLGKVGLGAGLIGGLLAGGWKAVLKRLGIAGLIYSTFDGYGEALKDIADKQGVNVDELGVTDKFQALVNGIGKSTIGFLNMLGADINPKWVESKTEDIRNGTKDALANLKENYPKFGGAVVGFLNLTEEVLNNSLNILGKMADKAKDAIRKNSGAERNFKNAHDARIDAEEKLWKQTEGYGYHRAVASEEDIIKQKEIVRKAKEKEFKMAVKAKESSDVMKDTDGVTREAIEQSLIKKQIEYSDENIKETKLWQKQMSRSKEQLMDSWGKKLSIVDELKGELTDNEKKILNLKSDGLDRSIDGLTKTIQKLENSKPILKEVEIAPTIMPTTKNNSTSKNNVDYTASDTGKLKINDAYTPKADHGKRKETTNIIMHRTAGSGFRPNDTRATEKGIAGHYTVDKDGEIYQQVPDENVAWHSKGGWNKKSIGIEVVGLHQSQLKKGDNRDWSATGGWQPTTKKQEESVKKLALHLAKKYNISVDKIIAHGGAKGTNKNPTEGHTVRDSVKKHLVSNLNAIKTTIAEVKKTNMTKPKTVQTKEAEDEVKVSSKKPANPIQASTSITPNEKALIEALAKTTKAITQGNKLAMDKPKEAISEGSMTVNIINNSTNEESMVSV